MENFVAISVMELSAALHAKISAAGSCRRGIYNAQDPTAFAHAECYVTFEHDEFLFKDYEYVPTEEELKEYPKEAFGGFTPSACYKILAYDCTWGTEYKLLFQTVDLDEEGREHSNMKDSIPNYGAYAASFYVEHTEKRLILRDRTDRALAEKVLRLALDYDATWSNKPADWEAIALQQEFDDAIGPASRYE